MELLFIKEKLLLHDKYPISAHKRQYDNQIEHMLLHMSYYYI